MARTPQTLGYARIEPRRITPRRARADPTYMPRSKEPPMPLSAKPYAAKTVRRHRRLAHGLHRCRHRRGDRLPARQPHLVLPVAQRHAPLRRPRPARGLRPDRHGRQRQALPLRPRPLHLRRAAPLPVGAVGQARARRQDRARRCTTGARRWASSGRAAIPIASPASSTWRRSWRRSPGPTGPRTHAAPSRASARRPART